MSDMNARANLNALVTHIQANADQFKGEGLVHFSAALLRMCAVAPDGEPNLNINTLPSADVDELLRLAHAVAAENDQVWVVTADEDGRCARCGRAPDNDGQWIATWDAGVLVESLCPDCQTPEDYTEAEVNDATLGYSRDESGRLMGTPKGVDDE